MDNLFTLSRVEALSATPKRAESTPPVPECPAPAPTPTPKPEATECCMDALAMAYVPMQKWQELYEPDVAFARATLFAQLDKPFIGEEVRFK